MPPTTATAEPGTDADRCTLSASATRSRSPACRRSHPASPASARPSAARPAAQRQGAASTTTGLPARPSRLSASRAPTPPSSAVLTQVGAQPALHVGAGAHPQHVQGHQLGGVLQRRAPLGRDLAVHRRPDRAQHLVARTDRDRDPLLADRVGPEVGRVDHDGAVLAVELAEDAELGEHLARTAPAPGGR